MKFKLFGLSLFFLLLSAILIAKNTSVVDTVGYYQTDSLKTAAFQVLENNCNECHKDKKPTYVFTLDNMDFFAATINIQVFVKEKMPKGRKNELSPADRKTLQLWINQVLSKQ
jgi:uncharacterized membrane protein